MKSLTKDKRIQRTQRACKSCRRKGRQRAQGTSTTSERILELNPPLDVPRHPAAVLDLGEVGVLGGHGVLLRLGLPLHLYPTDEALQCEPCRVCVLVCSLRLLQRSHESHVTMDENENVLVATKWSPSGHQVVIRVNHGTINDIDESTSATTRASPTILWSLLECTVFISPLSLADQMFHRGKS